MRPLLALAQHGVSAIEVAEAEARLLSADPWRPTEWPADASVKIRLRPRIEADSLELVQLSVYKTPTKQ